jgi:hypothetical protein
MAPTLIRMLLPVAAAAATGLAVAPPTAASAGVNLQCFSADSRYRCDLGFTSNPVMTSIRWYVNGIHRIPFDQRTTVIALCAEGQVYDIRVTIRDLTADQTPPSEEPGVPDDTNTERYTTRFHCGRIGP